ncbi:MAG TPA: hypothetical protein VJQ49_07065 [Casimicrobiaceae bacterium]|nr:hypothetical protein [Casimicrobiaceae bacterium]
MPYLPAFHDIGRELDVPPIAVQQTLSVYLFACAFMIGAFISGRGAGRMAPLRTIGLGNIVMFAGVVLDVAISVSYRRRYRGTFCRSWFTRWAAAS